MKAHWRSILLAGAMAVAFFGDSPSWGQSTPWWKTPPDTITANSADKAGNSHAAISKPKVVFTDGGMAWEISVDFVLVGREEVSLNLALAEKGNFEVQSAESTAMVQVVKGERVGDRGYARVAATYPRLSPQQAETRAGQLLDKLLEPARQEGLKQARARKPKDLREYLRDNGADALKPDDPALEAAQAAILKRLQRYLSDRKADDGVTDEKLAEAFANAWSVARPPTAIRDRMEEICRMRTQWAPAKDRQAWSQLSGRDLVGKALVMLEYELIDQYLQDLGLHDFDSNKPIYERILRPKFEGVHLIMAGKNEKADVNTVGKGLQVPEIQKLQQLLTAKLKCRLYPEIDPRDPDALWLNGQRVACKAVGVSSIRVEGKLDPGQGDRIDWWLLEHYQQDITQLELPKPSDDLEAEVLYVDDRVARLRILAKKDKPLPYVFEIRWPNAKGTVGVQVFEAPNATETKFPF